MPDSIVIAALSGRALAQSAQRGNMQSTVLDGFIDTDTRALAHDACRVEQENHGLCSVSLQQRLQSLPRSVARGGLVLGSGLERAIDVIEAWNHYYPVYGNSVEVLRCVNHARQFFALLDTLDIPYPETSFSPPDRDGAAWLVKQQRATGGVHVRHYYPGSSAYTADSYFQRFLMGTPISLLFLANGSAVSVTGFNTQWITAQGNRPFVYRGAVNWSTLSLKQQDEVTGFAQKLTQALTLIGLNTLDCILTENGLQVLELNPRPGATLTLYDQDIAGGLLRQHIKACRGRLPAKREPVSTKIRAHEILYAENPISIADDFQWPAWSSDRPAYGAVIEAGRPICSVQAKAGNISSVSKKLDSYKRRLSSQFKQCRVAA